MRKNNYKNIVIVIVIVIVLGILFALPKLNDPYKALKKEWAKAGIQCLIGGHLNLAQHIHPQLTIKVDGIEELIPAKIGNVQTCMAEIHTHEEGGAIHFESVNAGENVTLGQFFKVWGKIIEREGHSLKVTVAAKEVTDPGNLILKDKEEVMMEYTTEKMSN